MRKLCPNLDRIDGLDTVLEVPIPEEMFSSSKPKKHHHLPGPWSRLHLGGKLSAPSSGALGRSASELQLLLGVVGAPLVPLPVTPPPKDCINHSIKQDPIEVSTAKYIVRQYVAAAGGVAALGAIGSMYAMGKVRMMATETAEAAGGGGSKKAGQPKGGGGAAAGRWEMGGFVLWQKKPELWCLELVVSGCKVSAGSDGKVAWRQTPWHPPHVSRGPPRPLRRSLQGLDPRSTANMFSNAVCTSERTVNGENCFVLRLDAESSVLRSRSSANVDIIRHTVWGCFSHRTGLLVQLEDSHLLRMKPASAAEESVYWETTMESTIEDYRPIDGVYIAHAGRTAVSLFRFGDGGEGHARTRMEETWEVEEVEFNIRGLSSDCFLPPADMKREQDQTSTCYDAFGRSASPRLPSLLPSFRTPSNSCGVRMGSSKVAAVEVGYSDSSSDEE